MANLGLKKCRIFATSDEMFLFVFVMEAVWVRFDVSPKHDVVVVFLPVFQKSQVLLSWS